MQVAAPINTFPGLVSSTQPGSLRDTTSHRGAGFEDVPMLRHLQITTKRILLLENHLGLANYRIPIL